MAERKPGAVTDKPHDALVKHTFSQREHAAGLIRAALPPGIATLFRWPTLKAEQAQFVDIGLRGRYADLLFSVEADAGQAERVYVYVLLEHQRKVDPLMIFRMGTYMWRHWERLVRDDPARRTLPAILPILVHHSATGWTAATAFEDVLAIPAGAREALADYVPRFRMKLVDVSRDPSGGLAREALTHLGRVVLWCLSVGTSRARLEGEIDQLVPELNALYTAPNAPDALGPVLRYLAFAHPALGAENIAKLLVKAARKGKDEVKMDFLDKIEARGRKAGLEQGRQGQAQMLLKQIEARFGSVPATVRERVLAASVTSLERWGLRVLTAPTMDAVFQSRATVATAKKPTASTKRPASRKRTRTARP